MTMTLQSLIFYGFAAMALLAGGLVIFSKNPVRAVLFLILCFFSTSSLWLLLEADFLALTLVLVYVGAVMVLFLFVVMMLDIEVVSLKEGFTRYLPLGLIVACLMMFCLAYAVDKEGFRMPSALPDLDANYSQVQKLGELLYSQYLYPFELAGVLLLVAIVAAISLAFRGNRGSKAPAPGRQIEVRKSDRLRIIKMPSEKRENAAGNTPL